ncbi:MAG: DUF2344 domain-containing protein [Deltaproteobacteria bacterium]|nr:DUF2344 domain-containing protein [Deltaproteobacteria bacterium]
MKRIIETVQDSFDLGWQVIKLYFMIGLPSERKEDIQGIVDLVKKLRKIKGHKGKYGKINVSVSTFIPKPHTPFQWEPQLSLNEAKERINWIKSNLKMPGIRFKWQNPETSMLEGLFARGNRQLSRLLVSAHEKGCKFDGWSDRFDFGLWKEACEDTGVEIEYLNKRKRKFDEPLPWDHIDTKVSKDFLKEEREKAENLESTGDCRMGDCKGCGVCDFEVIEPIVFKTSKKQKSVKIEKKKDISYRKLKVSFSKTGTAKYFGHLELVNIMFRAIKRADIDIQYSQGFHPKPKVSFEDPLALGIESESENMYFAVSHLIKREEMVQRLNKQLPEGLEILSCTEAPSKTEINRLNGFTYRIRIKDFDFDESAIQKFKKKEVVIVERLNKKGKIIKINLKNVVLNINLTSKKEIEFILKPDNGKTVRPYEVLKKIFNFTDKQNKQALVVKIGSIRTQRETCRSVA